MKKTTTQPRTKTFDDVIIFQIDQQKLAAALKSLCPNPAERAKRMTARKKAA